MAEARTSSTMLNNSGENRHSCLVPECGGKALSFPTLTMILVVGLLYIAFMVLRYIPSIPTLLRVYIKNQCYTLSNAFSASIERIIWFLSFLLLMRLYHID